MAMNKWWLVALPPAVVLLSLCLLHSAAGEERDLVPRAAVAKTDSGSNETFDGLWRGGYGGGQRDGVVFQPMIAELFIAGNHVELQSFPNVGSLTGTVHFDASARRMRITPAPEAAGQAAPKDIEYVYEIKLGRLTLIDSEKSAFSLSKEDLALNPLANATVHFVEATGINDARALLVTEFAEIRVGRAGAIYYKPNRRVLHTKQAAVLLVQETGLQPVSLDEARRLIRKPTPVVVAYKSDPPPIPPPGEWSPPREASPDSEAAARTFARVLRPGTLVFVLSERENGPVP